MPQRQTLFEWLAALITHPSETLRILFILFLGEAARWMYGGGRFRERCGDAIICVLLFYLVRPWIPIIPPVCGVKILPGSVAILIALLGGHVCAQVLAWAFEKKTGIKLEKK